MTHNAISIDLLQIGYTWRDRLQSICSMIQSLSTFLDFSSDCTVYSSLIMADLMDQFGFWDENVIKIYNRDKFYGQHLNGYKIYVHPYQHYSKFYINLRGEDLHTIKFTNFGGAYRQSIFGGFHFDAESITGLPMHHFKKYNLREEVIGYDVREGF